MFSRKIEHLEGLTNFPYHAHACFFFIAVLVSSININECYNVQVLIVCLCYSDSLYRSKVSMCATVGYPDILHIREKGNMNSLKAIE